MKSWEEELFQNGFIVVKDAVSSNIIERSKKIMREALCKLLNKSVSLEEGVLNAAQLYYLFDVQMLLHRELVAYRILRGILLEQKVLNILLHSLGPDLSYDRQMQVTINLKSVKDPLYVKKMHQEIWSGAGINGIRIWAPLYMPEMVGGIEFIVQSHLWGLIPNRNREPMELPKNYEIIRPEVQEGDVILLHPLTLHATVEHTKDYPRIAISAEVRNFYHAFSGHEQMTSWKPFHFSPMAQIQKALGNRWLTPFRTLGGPLDHTQSGDNKKTIPEVME